MLLTYAGIGARKTPLKTLGIMTIIAAELADLGFTLRTGGAKGADDAFMRGALALDKDVELYLPAKNKAPKDSPPNVKIFPEPMYDAFEIAASVHKNWGKLSDYVRRLHARNAHIILGPDLKSPSSFVVLWTENGEKRGGTGIGWQIAEDYSIPVFNLFDEKQLDALIEFVADITREAKLRERG